MILTLTRPSHYFQTTPQHATLTQLLRNPTATQGIYDTNAIAEILARAGRTDAPEFLPQSHAPFYKYPTGSQTPFGEQASLTTQQRKLPGYTCTTVRLRGCAAALLAC